MSEAFLGVESSAKGRRWIGPDVETSRATAAMSQQAGIPEIVAAMLVRMDVEASQAAAYLTPALRDLMPDPSSLLDMDTATEVFIGAVLNKTSIAIFADYDVDGGASAALLMDWLVQMGVNPTLYIPDRIDEGYGPNTPAMLKLAQNHQLIICVDCGTLSHEPIAAAKNAGAKILVFDHHQGGETLPNAGAVVNPNRQDETSPLTYLCAAGVVFLLLVSSNRALRAQNLKTPDLIAMLDLVALATVADVAPLVGLNRAFVRQGLSVMGKRQRPGLTALADVAGLRSAPSAYHLGFLLGPRVNAGGRIGQADLGAKLLATADPLQAKKMAEKLDLLNTERRAIEADVRLAAEAQVETRDTKGALIWAAKEGWHPGVVGIVASRLKDVFNRPAIVIGLENGVGKGSGRSIPGIDLGAAVATLTREGLLEKGGGHKMAAGLSVEADKVEAAMARLSDLLAAQGSGKAGPKDLHIDALLSTTSATADLIEQIETAGPFGASAPAPRLALIAQRITFAKRAGATHLRLTLSDGNGRLDAICFGAFESPLGDMLESHAGRSVHIVGRLEIDDWGGKRKAKLRVEDAAFAE